MIAIFFKQSKPIVFLILGIVLSILFWVETGANHQMIFSLESIGLIILKYLILISVFVIFELKIKFFEIQTGHSFVTLFFVLLFSFLIKDILSDNTLFSFFILSVGIIRLLNLCIGWNVKSSIFESVFLICVASIFYKPTLVFLILVLVVTIIFTKSRWRNFIIPVLSISSFVILVQLYHLIYSESVVGYQFFLPELNVNLQHLLNNDNISQGVFWMACTLIFLYQIYSVKLVRSLYHRQMASVFLAFLILAFISMFFNDSTISGLWFMSLWPFCIYLGDFVSRIKKNLWLQVVFWGFTIASLALYTNGLVDII